MVAEDHLNAQQFIHTTNAKLRVGSIIKPASELGHKSRWANAPGYDPSKVYISDADRPVHEVEHFGDHDYEVKPLGPIQRDPEWALLKKDYPDLSDEDVPGYHSYQTTRAKVIRKREY